MWEACFLVAPTQLSTFIQEIKTNHGKNHCEDFGSGIVAGGSAWLHSLAGFAGRAPVPDSQSHPHYFWSHFAVFWFGGQLRGRKGLLHYLRPGVPGPGDHWSGHGKFDDRTVNAGKS